MEPKGKLQAIRKGISVTIDSLGVLGSAPSVSIHRLNKLGEEHPSPTISGTPVRTGTIETISNALRKEIDRKILLVGRRCLVVPKDSAEEL